MSDAPSMPADAAMLADVGRAAHLARLHLSDDELRRFAADLGRILAYVRQLQELDVEGVEPTAHARPISNVFRDDAVAPGLSREAAMANAPAARGGLFIVPRILE